MAEPNPRPEAPPPPPAPVVDAALRSLRDEEVALRELAADAPALTQRRFHVRLALAAAGAAVLFLGIFLPLLSLPMGAVNYFNNGRGDGVWMMLLAGGSVLLAARGYFGLLWATGAAAFVLLGLLVFQIQREIEAARQAVELEYGGTPMAGVAQVAVDSIRLEWGFAVMAAGAVLILAAAAYAPQRWSRA